MPYTLMKGLAWVLLAVLLGIVIGWLLRSVVAKRQVARARNHHVDRTELERLRGRVANLEPVVAERDRLKDELEACRSARVAAARGSEVTEVADVGVPAGDASRSPDPSVATVGVEAQGFADPAGASDLVGATGHQEAPMAPAAPDIAGAAAVFGRSIVLDDLTAVEGIGPKIQELCHGIGIRTWFDLSTTEVSLLRTMLTDAGPRFRTHDPATWPQQAGLLAEGRWQEFRALTEQLRGGRAGD